MTAAIQTVGGTGAVTVGSAPPPADAGVDKRIEGTNLEWEPPVLTAEQLAALGISGGAAAAPVGTAPTANAQGGVTTLNSTTQPESAVGGASSSDATKPPRGPYSFIWNGKYFYPMAPAGGIDITNMMAVQTRMLRSVVQHMLEYEQVDDFAITSYTVRDVDPVRDADLLAVNPGARYVADTVGHTPDGTTYFVPVVMNSDGATYVDPKIRY